MIEAFLLLLNPSTKRSKISDQQLPALSWISQERQEDSTLVITLSSRLLSPSDNFQISLHQTYSSILFRQGHTAQAHHENLAFT